MQSLASIIGAAVLSLGLATAAQAQSAYPEETITLVVPFAAGGPTDTVGRLVAQVMSENLGQQILVQNVGGAGGTLGAGQVAKAAPDGYTLLLHNIGMSTAPSLYRNLAFNPTEAFATIGLVTAAPMTIVGRKDFEPADGKALVEYLKENGEDVTLAHAGVGASSHLCAILLQAAVGVRMVTVPYNGTGPALTDILGGQVDLLCDQTTNTTTQILGGGVKAYAATTTERVFNLPDLPTTAEIGLPDVQVGVWHGLYAPVGTDPAIVDRLEQALQAALADERVVTRFADLGTTPVPAEQATSEALTETLTSQIEAWRPIIEASGEFAN